MREHFEVKRAPLLTSIIAALAASTIAGAALAVGAASPPAVGVLDITAEADVCVNRLGYQLAATTIVRDNVSEGSIGFGPSPDFEGGQWNLEDSLTPIEGKSPSHSRIQALDLCAGELRASRGYGVSRIEERPAPAAVAARMGDCLTRAGFGPDRITFEVLETGDSGQMRIETIHSLPENELAPLEQTLSKCMISHLELPPSRSN